MIGFQPEDEVKDPQIINTAWTFRLGKDADILFQTDIAPNWFHRLTQKIILGVYWTRVEGIQ